MKYSDSELKILNNKDSSAELLYAKTALLIKKWFNDKYDKGGAPYINHLLFVASCALTDTERISGLLHDIIEDTEVTFEDLIKFGYPEEVIEILKLLTRDKTIPYDIYIDDIIKSNNKSALRIKKRDLEHNMDPSRLSDKMLIEKLQNKYRPIYKKVVEALEKEEK